MDMRPIEDIRSVRVGPIITAWRWWEECVCVERSGFDSIEVSGACSQGSRARRQTYNNSGIAERKRGEVGQSAVGEKP